MIIEIKKKLYHGSYTIVDKPDLSKCGIGKDFGQGFYLTTDIDQARRFVRSSIGKAAKNGKCDLKQSNGFISVFELSGIEDLVCYEFGTADREWLHCVAMQRRNGLFAEQLKKWDRYDVIVGKIANDNTNQVITAYINGVYGEVGSDIADRTAIGLLMPDKLTDQICVRTDKALQRLIFSGSEEVVVKERS